MKLSATEKIEARGYCIGPAERVPSPGEVDASKRAACGRCGKRVAVTVRGLFAHHRPAVITRGKEATSQAESGGQTITCLCGEAAAPLTAKEISAYNKLRDRKITVCPCGHEVMAPQTSHDVRKISAIGNQLAHTACAKARAPWCSEWVNEPGTVLGRRCARKAVTKNAAGKPVCSWHREGRIFRETA